MLLVWSGTRSRRVEPAHDSVKSVEDVSHLCDLLSLRFHDLITKLLGLGIVDRGTLARLDGD